MAVERKYRDCIICGEHIAEITTDKRNLHSRLTYFRNADLLTIARSDAFYCKNCANTIPKGSQSAILK